MQVAADILKGLSLEHIRSFQQVADTGGFRAAAQKMNVSQGTLSAHIAALEDALNVQLMARTTRVINVVMNARETVIGNHLCQVVYYPQYFYQDTLQFEFRNNLSDLTTGSFAGTGQVNSYTDFSRPNGYGAVYGCNNGFPVNDPGLPYPRPYPLKR